MVDFDALDREEEDARPIDPIQIFEELPKGQRINDLYDSQATILRKWYASLRNKKDVVIGLNTGGGKTLVGLLIGLSIMRENHSGVLYLVENKQLAEQVVTQAHDLGIPASAYKGRASVDADFDNGDSILVGSYQCLFNGQSVFGLRGTGDVQRVAGIIIDDAHASLGALRDAFTLSISAEKSNGLYQNLMAEFRSAFEDIDRQSTYHDFMNGVGNGVVEIPLWSWFESLDYAVNQLSMAFSKSSGDDEFSAELRFKWPLLRDGLKYCQAFVSRNAFTITSLYPRIDLFPTFTEAQHRIFMSATFSDYGDMVRSYDLRDLSTDSIIAPQTVSGIGRMMILPLTKDISQSKEFATLMESTAKHHRGVIRLVPRQGTDESWPSVRFNEPIGSDAVSIEVSKLQNRQEDTPVSFVNRYNGIDLPGEACRVLIIRDLPAGNSDYDELMNTYLKNSAIKAERIAQRIEQGVGRGVRGSSDYCVVLLEGRELLDWLKRDKNRMHLSAGLRAQLDMGQKISEQLHGEQDFYDTLEKGMDDDERWKKFHARFLAKKISGEGNTLSQVPFKMACCERRAFACWLNHESNKAVSLLVKASESPDYDPQYRGWLLSLASRIEYEAKHITEADELQHKANSYNRAILYSPTITSVSFNYSDETRRQARAIIQVLHSNDNRADAEEVFDTETAALTKDANHRFFESALERLGEYLGFEAGRADDNGVGPDVYWIGPNRIAFVLEAKNEKDVENPFHKKEAGQLRTAKDWLAQKHPGYCVIPVSVHPNIIADKAASATTLYVLTLEETARLREAVREIIVGATRHSDADRENFICGKIRQRCLSGDSIVKEYLKTFKCN